MDAIGSMTMPALPNTNKTRIVAELPYGTDVILSGLGKGQGFSD